MTESSKPSSPVKNLPETNITNEVRYAVVMYGGVSLCIYINGVAQELLEMAKATASDGGGVAIPKEKLSASARLYRRLGQYLDSDSMDAALLFKDSESDEIRTRFVVDVLSGTSAGGLNSIFLAKALVNNEDMEGLKQLWMNEGDIERLLNDRKSSLPELPAKRQPDSLLNSQRMYAKLLEALHVMDFPNDENFDRPSANEPAPPPRVPLVEELDLYVTATDLTGLPIYLKLDNTVANELRHKNVFNFRYRADANDFTWEFNPLLAFAGRCTSSIPPAFEPMRLEDTSPVLRARRPYRAMAENGSPKWKPVYSEYLKTNETGDFRKRDFGDGGFLDNKPFTYATRALMRRQAHHPIRRKLIYIEPSPERLALDPASPRPKPDAIAHSLAALVELPRYETIREDIGLILDRNHLLARIDETTRRVDQDVDALIHRFREKVIQSAAAETFERIPLKDHIKKLGIAYGTYHRLKVAEVTSDLAALVSDILNYPPESDEHLAIRLLVEAWRKSRYAADPPDQDPQIDPDKKIMTESKFLMDFDPSYRLRRLFFIHRKITFFYRFVPGSSREQGDADALPPKIADILKSGDESRWRRFREELLKIKLPLAKALADLRRDCHALRKSDELKNLIKELKLDKKKLVQCLSDDSTARQLIAKAPKFKEISDHLVTAYKEAFIKVSKVCKDALADTGSSPEGKIARDVLRDIYERFDHYDMAILPMQYGTNSSETPHVDIVRISPTDAKNLCDDSGGQRSKLAGRMYFSFGAFFAKFWRENDMLWGRLDGAEILVRDLLRNTPVAETQALGHPTMQERDLQPNDSRTLADVFIDDLHTAILSDTLPAQRREDAWNMLHDVLPKLDPAMRDKEMKQFFNDSPTLEKHMQSIKDFCKDDAALLSYYKTSYEVNRQLEPKVLLRLFARGSQIFGKMLEKIGSDRGKNPKQIHTAFIVRAAAIFSGLVEVSVPRTPWAILWRYWRSLFYIIGALLVLVGLIFGKGAVQSGGVLVLILTGIIHIATIWLQLFIGRWKYLKFASATLISLIVAIFLVLGLWKAFELPTFLQERWGSTLYRKSTASPEE
jgi:patatin-related protein